MDPAVKRFLNSLRCPLCKGQLDLLDWSETRKKDTQYNFYCVYEPEHYAVWCLHWVIPPQIESERVILYEGEYQFVVSQQHHYQGPQTCTTIKMSQVDPENRVIEGLAPKFFTYDKHLFDFTKTNKEKILNRIKTILVFQ